jgi:aldose 1-epimerase
VRKRPWTVAEHSAQQLRCTFLSSDYQNVDWPWAFEVQASYTLTEHSLHMHLQLYNRSDAPMPAGCGWHPYFSRHLKYPGEPVMLQYQVHGAYPDAHGNRIPSGPVQKLSENQNFLAAKELTPQNVLDTCFYGFQGGHIAWPESDIGLRMVASESCAHLIIYNPDGKPYFAVEPVTNANNGVNLLTRGDETSGIVVLENGEVLEADCTLYLEQI